MCMGKSCPHANLISRCKLGIEMEADGNFRIEVQWITSIFRKIILVCMGKSCPHANLDSMCGFGLMMFLP